MYKDNWTQPWPMSSKIYPEVHENHMTFFNSSSPILLEPLAHGSSDRSLPREDCIIFSTQWQDIKVYYESLGLNMNGDAVIELSAQNFIHIVDHDPQRNCGLGGEAQSQN